MNELDNAEQWLRRNGVHSDEIYKYSGRNLGAAVQSIRDVQTMLAFGLEFYLRFRGKEYFFSPCPDVYWISGKNGLIFETDDLDDFGENARIGENGEFLLKDVASELE